MKYKVTEKHPYLKEGLIIEDVGKSPDYGFSIYNLGEAQELLSSKTHVSWMQYGWIEEIQEAEFTKDDMKLFGAKCAQEWQTHKLLYADDELDKFVKKYKDEN